jgi:deazaflavin-dependent oxidoreductase (nitroreductase family)
MNEDVQRELMKGGVIDITTKGRRTGEPRRIEIRLHNIDDRLYLTGMPGPRSWHANLRANPTFTIHLKRDLVADVMATATPVQSDDERRRVHRRILENMGKPEELDARMKSSPLMVVKPLQED